MLELYLGFGPQVNEFDSSDISPISDYVNIWSEENLLGKKIRYIELNDKGKTVAEFIMKKQGLQTNSIPVAALQKRFWYEPQYVDIPKYRFVNSLKKLIPKGNMLNGIYVVENLEEQYSALINKDFSGDELYVFNFLTKIIKHSRTDVLNTEIVIW